MSTLLYISSPSTKFPRVRASSLLSVPTLSLPIQYLVRAENFNREKEDIFLVKSEKEDREKEDEFLVKPENLQEEDKFLGKPKNSNGEKGVQEEDKLLSKPENYLSK